MNENPFNFSKPVKGKDFYNRANEINTAIGLIKKLQSFSVVGERRIGKTSFLGHILSEEVLRKNEIDPEKYIIIHFNMGELYEITKDVFIKTMVERIREQTRIEIESRDVFERLKAYAKRLSLDNKNLIIALDEFEVIEPILDDNLSHWLRFIFLESNAMVITASQTTVGEIGSRGKASPLFNIFGNLFLKPFTREETKRMISAMFLKGGKKLDEKEVSFLADLSGGNPYLVQFLGYYYYEKRKKNKEIDGEKFENEMLVHLRDLFENYLGHLDEEEREFLLKAESAAKDQVAHILERKGFVLNEEIELKIFSPLFEKFLRMKKTKMFDKEKDKNKEKKEEKYPFAAVIAFLAFLTSIVLSLSMFIDLASKAIPILFVLIFIISSYYFLRRLNK